MVKKASKDLGSGPEQLVDMIIKHCKCILELTVLVWHGAITQTKRANIERVKKGALYTISGETIVPIKMD